MAEMAPHSWNFFRAGDFAQVQLDTLDDLKALRSLDQKLWASLACPVVGLSLEPRLLAYIDSDGDGRIRVPELLAAVDWSLARLSRPETLFERAPLNLSDLSDDSNGLQLRQAAQHLCTLLGKEAGQGLSSADTADKALLFPPNQANGDGLIPKALCSDEALAQAIDDIVQVQGAQQDRSGEPAVGGASFEAFFDALKAFALWQAQRPQLDLQGDVQALQNAQGLREKIDDFFNRVALAEFEPRAASLLNASEEYLQGLAERSLANTQELASLPLAQVSAGAALPLQQGINPAWRAALAELNERLITPLLGPQQRLSAEQWQEVLAKVNDYLLWQAQRPDLGGLAALGDERLKALADPKIEAGLRDLIAADLAVQEAADGLVELDKLLLLREGLVELLRNFVSLQNFYGRREKAIFQAGTLYIDGKSCDLVLRVEDIDSHASVAAASGCYLLYLQCQRRGVASSEQVKLVAAVTAGSAGDLQVGRHGVFYDRQGQDWDAQVVKLVTNAISLREAFWSPYQKIAKLVGDQLHRLAAGRDAAVLKQATSKIEASATSAPAAAPAAPASFDIARFAGIFAALGLALGALGTALAALMTGLLSLAWWQAPLLVGGIVLLISGPAMLVAWFKLRKRSLGPILDGNGWAINARLRISIPFGTALTQLASLPAGSRQTARDPYAEPARRWPWVVLLLALLGLAGYLGVSGMSAGGLAELFMRR